MMLFRYKWRNANSTKPSEIFNEKNEVVGALSKTYPNIFKRIVDVYFKGEFFVEYEIRDGSGKIRVKSKKDTSILKKRQYYLEYFIENHKYEIHLLDYKVIDIVERTVFTFNDTEYFLEKKSFEKATLKVNDCIIAEWKESIKPPFTVSFELLDDNYKDHVLLLIGVFHTYLHVG